MEDKVMGQEKREESQGQGTELKVTASDLSLLKTGGFELSQFFARDILLIHTHLMGCQNVEDHMDYLKEISVGSRLTLLREPDNPVDERAILVLTDKGHKIGYVPRADNEILANLMDAGKELFAVISEIYSEDIEEEMWWRFLWFDIYLRD